MQWLILVHAIAAVIGVGPTFFGHVLTRRNQSVGDLRQSLKLSKYLEFFPKVGGTVAVLTGLLLVILSDDYTFGLVFIYTSLILYVLIQIVVIGGVAPRNKKLGEWSAHTSLADKEPLPAEQVKSLVSIDRLYYLASAMGTAIFVLMFLKP